MKTKILIPVIISSFFILPSAFGQGSLTPPSAPGPTMVTLSQIEPRTPISSAPYTISQPGSYYLTTNLTVSGGSATNAITINTNNVMLDLNGFSISSVGTGGNGAGIYIGGALENIMILNGSIQSGVTNNGSGVYSGNGFNWGIYCNGASGNNIRVSGVSVSGVWDYGIYLGGYTPILVENCEVLTAGSYGIVASTVIQSSAIDCGNIAIGANDASDCMGQCSGASYGILADGAAQNCYGTGGNDGYGVVAQSVQNCYGTCGTGTSGAGVSGICALNCYGSASGGGNGVSATTAQNCVGYSSGGGNGVSGGVLQNCFGSSSGGGNGIYTEYLAIGCYGYNSSGPGVNAYIANCCYSSSGDGSITYKYNMP